jgi:2,4-dienoyl-CoA reductase-like NADH-dependent reductase (Old Yellow Enzyme family)
LKISRPLAIKSLTLANRLVRSSTWEGLAARDGRCTDALTDYLGTLVSGKVGLLITGFAFIHRSGIVLPYMTGIDDDSRIEGLRKLTDHIHRLGGKIAIQLSHGGAESRPELIGDHTLKVPSLLEGMKRPKLESAMTGQDIALMVECFARAAARSRLAGFDAVQIQACHGYLISRFLSPLANVRKDGYGGTVRNRARFLFEVYEAVRGVVGDDFPVLVKVNAADFVAGGLEFVDAFRVMEELAGKGVDAIEVSGGIPEGRENGPVRKGVRAGEGEAYFAPFARAVRETVAPVPVIAVGGIRSREVAENLLVSGAADMAALSRPLVREPGLPDRWLNGDGAASACVSCSRCFPAGLSGKGIACGSKGDRQ